ncbi:isopeptide-forming domain-containing fimbrial protein [Lactobacillus sp.]|uniref:isopeptide-forming domain-containing fimbrial protein n=1 Tax=Lactobacillus sp. TaxID=1591 RepID=UPI003EFDD6AA
MTRKLSSLFSALVLLFGLLAAIPASLQTVHAASSIKVTINGTDSKYNGYQLLKAEVGSDDAVTYTLNSKYKDIVLKAASDASGKTVSDFDGLKDFIKAHSKSDNSTAGEDATLRKFADAAYKGISSAKLEADQTFKSGENTLSTDNAGYYLLADATADNASDPHNYSATLLTGLVNKDVTLNVKSTTPTVHKKVLEGNPGATSSRDYVDATDYNIGDTVPFMVTGTISSQIKSYDNYTYYFTDTLPKGLTLDESSIVVQAENVTSGYAKGINATGATKLTKGTDYTVTTTKNNDGSTTFKVELTDLKKLVEAGTVKTSDTIVVTYNTKLNENAVVGQAGNVNNVKLTYSNNPYSNGTGTTTNKNAKVYTYELVVNKTGNGNKPLTGAGFTLQKKDGDTYKTIATINPDKTTDNSSIVAKIVDGTKFQFSGLDQGEYKIVESTVPKGYKKADDIEFKISATFDKQNSADAALTSLSVNNSALSADTASGVIETTVNNKSDSAFVLPSTGGMGRYIFLAAGALVVIAAIAAPSLKKKRAN